MMALVITLLPVSKAKAGQYDDGFFQSINLTITKNKAVKIFYNPDYLDKNIKKKSDKANYVIQYSIKGKYSFTHSWTRNLYFLAEEGLPISKMALKKKCSCSAYMYADLDSLGIKLTKEQLKEAKSSKGLKIDSAISKKLKSKKLQYFTGEFLGFEDQEDKPLYTLKNKKIEASGYVAFSDWSTWDLP